MKRSSPALPCVLPFLLMCRAFDVSAAVMPPDILVQGRVSMIGSIMEAPCTIAVGEQAQTVVMKTLPIEQLARAGQGPEQGFTLRLVDCILPRPDLGQSNWQLFQMTFDGARDREHFGVFGTAQGVALRIQDTQGQAARPGETLPVTLMPGDPTLHYRVNLVSNQQPLKAGEYRSAIRFRMDYY
ncbi:fimbrial protein [Serratia aquatilis]|uniref:Fimbrial protein n=1 Tax=Serratia aquatilis TaxID=1737515 RepID=A0ABV6EEM9_9GAMM